jgi:hypothetical protein
VEVAAVQRSERALPIWIVAAGVFAYVLWFRTHDITTTFYLRGDQARDWDMALRRFGDLPLGGVPSLTGGTTLGPVFYWFMWATARVFGPFVDYLPHAGGFGLAAFQSAADAVLLIALTARLRSLLSALAIVLCAATSGYDATLSSTVWNPACAVAFAKLAIASLLWSRDLSWLRAWAVVATGWLAAQAHTPGIVVAIPVIGWVIAEPAFRRQWRTSAARAGMAAATVGVLQIPWAIYQWRYAVPGRDRMGDSVWTALMAPTESIHLGDSLSLMIRSLSFILGGPYDIPWFGWMLAAGSLATAALTRDVALIVSSLGAMATAAMIYALWQGPLDQAYWFLALAPSAAIALMAWMSRLPRPWLPALPAVALLAIALAQPARATMAWTFHRLPGYGALVEGCRSIVADGRSIRDVRTAFPLPADTDPRWVLSRLGGGLDGGSAEIAIIDVQGSVEYRLAPRN